MDSDRSLLQDFLLSAGFGLLLAIFYLFVAGGIVASWSAGTAYFLFFFAWARLFGPPGYWGMVVLAGTGGALAAMFCLTASAHWGKAGPTWSAWCRRGFPIRSCS